MIKYNISKASKLLGVSCQTLRNWDKNGKLTPHHKTDSGYRYYSEEQINKIIAINETQSSNSIQIILNCDLSDFNKANKLYQLLKELTNDNIKES